MTSRKLRLAALGFFGLLFLCWPRVARAQVVIANVPVQADFSSAGGWWYDPNFTLAGDFDCNGFTDFAYVFEDANSTISIDVYLSHPNGQGDENFTHQRWATQIGSWATMWATSGDFNGDGCVDIAVEYEHAGNVDIDVYASLGSLASGGFQKQQWIADQTSWEDASYWLSGDFNGDGTADLAYVWSDGGLISVDVYASTWTQSGFEFVPQRWMTQQGGWIDLSMGNPTASDQHVGQCSACTRNAQWVAGDFNGDGLTDIGFAYSGTSGIDIDLRLSNGGAGVPSSDGFVLQHAAINQWGWVPECFWVAEDMDGDGRADMVNVFAAAYVYPSWDQGDADVDVHFSNIPYGSLTVDSNTALIPQRIASNLPDDYWVPVGVNGMGEHGENWLTGGWFGGVFRNWLGTGELLVAHIANDTGGPIQFNLFGPPSPYPPPAQPNTFDTLPGTGDPPGPIEADRAISSGWIMGTVQDANGDFGIFHWNPETQQWTESVPAPLPGPITFFIGVGLASNPQPMGAQYLTVDLLGDPWIIDHTGQVYQGIRSGPDPYAPGAWWWLPFGPILPAYAVAVGTPPVNYFDFSAEVYALKWVDNSIWQLSSDSSGLNGQWFEMQPGAAGSQIMAVSTPEPICGTHAPMVMGLDGDPSIYRWVVSSCAPTPGFFAIGGGSFAYSNGQGYSISTDFTVGLDGNLYQWNPSASDWQFYVASPFGVNTTVGSWINGLFIGSKITAQTARLDDYYAGQL